MESSRAEKKLDAVIQGARSILGEKDFTSSARSIFDHCCALTGATAGYVALLSEDGEENEVLFLEAGGLPCNVNPALPMPIRGLRAISYQTHQAVFENDFMHSRWLKFLPAGHVAMRNVMFAPLNLEGKTVGIMGLANKPGDFTKEDAEIASVFGELAAIALLNSRYIDLLQEKRESLEKALSEIKTLRGIVPICMHCKQIRDDEGYWQQVDRYVSDHSEVEFSHSICESCLEKHYPPEEVE